MKKRTLCILWFLGSTLVFLWALFPSAFLESYLEGRAGQMAPQLNLDLTGVGLSVPPGLVVDSVGVNTMPGVRVEVTDVKASPLWLSLVTGSPGGKLSLGFLGGKIAIKGRTGYAPPLLRGADVKASALDLSNLASMVAPFLPVPLSFSGRADGTLHLEEKEGLKGEGMMAVRGLRIGLQSLPFKLEDLTFASVDGEVEVDGFLVKLKSIKAKGTQLSADFKGSITLQPRIESSRLAISGAIFPDAAFAKRVADRVPLAMIMDPKKLKQRRIPIRIEGTLKRPRVSLN